MKLKTINFLNKGKKFLFSLFLFALVFGVASYLKVQAGSGHNVTGWLWGGGAENDGVKPWDGSNTNVRWISVNSDNPEVSHAIPYGVNIPASDGNLTGYAWSGGDDSGLGLGWIDFNPNGDDGIQNTADDHCTTGSPGATQYQAASCAAVSNCGSPGVRRVGDGIEGCARIVEIAKASAIGNSGGWAGWLKVKGSTYGVKISMMDGVAKDPSSDTAGTAGADELGWIDFSRAKIGTTCSNVVSLGATLADSTCTEVFVSVQNSVDGETLTLSENSPKIEISTNSNCLSPSSSILCVLNSNQCSFFVKGSDFSVDDTIPVTIEGCGGGIANIFIVHTPNCDISCPESIIIAPGAAKSFACSVSGASCSAESCRIDEDKNSILESAIFDLTSKQCDVKVKAGADFRYSAIVKTTATGGVSDTTKILLKRLGWIETNP